MPNRRKEQDLARQERRIKRSEREDSAGKLLSMVPDLTSIHIAIHETRPKGFMGDTHYIRRIVLEHAPALFEVTCSDPHCEDGGYDVTQETLLALADRRTHFEGEQACPGRCGALDCARVLRYVVTATYREAPSAAPAQGPAEERRRRRALTT